MDVLVSFLFCIWCACQHFSFRVWESFVQYRHDFAQEPHTHLHLFAGLLPQDSLMSSCNCIIMSVACLIQPYVGFPDFDYQPYSSSLSRVQPSRSGLYIFCSFINPYPEDTSPRVPLSYMCFLASSIGMFHYLELACLSLTLVSSQLRTIKNFYSFSRFSKYMKQSKKIKKT